MNIDAPITLPPAISINAPLTLPGRIVIHAPITLGGGAPLTNARVNAALAVDPAASRAAIGLGSAATASTTDFAAVIHGHVISDITGLQTALDGKQPAGNYVTTADARLTDAREWTAETVSQAEAEAGSATTRRAWTAQRVRQAIAAWWAASAFKTKLDGIATGATANATDAQLRDRSTHTGTQTTDTISGLDSALSLLDEQIAQKQPLGDYIIEGDSRLTDAREWTASTVTQAEAEAGSATTRRAWTAQRVRQAIEAWFLTLAVAFRNFLANPTSANFALWLSDANGTAGGFVRAQGATLANPTITGSISGSAVPSVLQNQAGSTRPICILFEDFPGIAGAGTHPWNDSGTGSTDAMATGGAGQFMGTCRLVTGTTSGNSRTRSLGIATSTVFIGAIVRYGFAIPDITSVNIGLGFAAGGSTCQLFYASASNSGQWTLITNAGVTTFTAATPQAGNYFSGKRYQLEIERISTTQTRILLEIADFNLANWSTVFSGTVTHGAVSANWGESTPSFGVTTQTNAARTLIVDWASLRLPMIIR